MFLTTKYDSNLDWTIDHENIDFTVEWVVQKTANNQIYTPGQSTTYGQSYNNFPNVGNSAFYSRRNNVGGWNNSRK